MLEKMLLTTVLLLMVFCTFSAYLGQDVGDVERIRLAKFQAQQELMATRVLE